MACVNRASTELQLRALLAARGMDSDVMNIVPNGFLHAAMSSPSNSVSAADWQPTARNSHVVSSQVGATGAHMPGVAGTDGLRQAVSTDLLCGDSAKHRESAARIPAPLALDNCMFSDAPVGDDPECMLLQPAHTQDAFAEDAVALPLPISNDPLHINPEYLQDLADFAESLKGQTGGSIQAGFALPKRASQAYPVSSAAGMIPAMSNSSGAGVSASEVDDLGHLQLSLLDQFLSTQQANALRAAHQPAAGALASNQQAAGLAVLAALQAQARRNASSEAGCDAVPQACQHAGATENLLSDRLGSGTASVSGDVLAGGVAEGVWDSPAREGGAHWSSDESKAHGRVDGLKLKPRSLKERARRERISEGLKKLRCCLPYQISVRNSDTASMIEAMVEFVDSLKARITHLEHKASKGV